MYANAMTDGKLHGVAVGHGHTAQLGVVTTSAHGSVLKDGAPLRVFDDQFRLEEPGLVLSLFGFALTINQE